MGIWDTVVLSPCSLKVCMSLYMGDWLLVLQRRATVTAVQSEAELGEMPSDGDPQMATLAQTAL